MENVIKIFISGNKDKEKFTLVDIDDFEKLRNKKIYLRGREG